MLQKIVNHDTIIKFCSNIKEFNLNKGSKLVGIDLLDDYLNFKLYIELLDVPSEEILSNFLKKDQIPEFINLSKFWDKSLNSSLALGI